MFNPTFRYSPGPSLSTVPTDGKCPDCADAQGDANLRSF